MLLPTLTRTYGPQPSPGPNHSSDVYQHVLDLFHGWSESGPGWDQDQTNIDAPWRSQSQSQKFCQGLDCLVPGPAKMAPDWTKLNFLNTSALAMPSTSQPMLG